MTICAAVLMSCTTTRPVKPETLESDVFVVNHIVFSSSTIKPTDEELIQMFQLFPYNKVADSVEEKTGIVLDLSLIDNNFFRENIVYNIVYDAETDEVIQELPQWEITFDPEMDDKYDQYCDLYFSMEPPDGFLTVKAVMHGTQLIPATKEGKEDKLVNLQTTCYETFDKWTFKNIFVDQRSCAQIKFHKNITPTFIENELYSIYTVLNSAGDGYINVNVKEPVEIRCNINDPGNMFFSPAEIYNASFVETFQPGKQYILKYKLKRRSPDSNNWIVVFNLKEVKAKQTK